MQQIERHKVKCIKTNIIKIYWGLKTPMDRTYAQINQRYWRPAWKTWLKIGNEWWIQVGLSGVGIPQLVYHHGEGPLPGRHHQSSRSGRWDLEKVPPQPSSRPSTKTAVWQIMPVIWQSYMDEWHPHHAELPEFKWSGPGSKAKRWLKFARVRHCENWPTHPSHWWFEKTFLKFGGGGS